MKKYTLALLAATAALGTAHATENGQLRALLGAPSYELASPQFPGWYGQLWLQHYSAKRLKGDDGQALQTQAATPLGTLPVQIQGEIDADVFVTRGTWVTEKLVAEGRLGFSATLPLIRQRNDIRLSATLPAGVPAGAATAVQALLDQQSAARSGSKTGQGDLDVAGFVDWQNDDSRLVLGLSVVAPTGAYDAQRAVNPGAGKFWTVRPLVIASKVWENGVELGLRATYSVNTRNTATDVRSGQYLHADYAAMYRINDEWRTGLQGYLVEQTTRDNGPGVAANGNKARVRSLGPMVAYVSEDGVWSAEFKVAKEFSVRNRPEGTTAWVRLNLRLD
ncbi:transporter [Pelomonas sp. APW6]|uniref:Transporter n=1 Tax=Roseateles subflavus TaxID=3053353 RepID=A0ABT7LF75_9BURK|nr:transporter [Pelomonas sp. APW6]MDL5031502.1 transporter [Pelomonas sp. APW6]